MNFEKEFAEIKVLLEANKKEEAFKKIEEILNLFTVEKELDSKTKLETLDLLWECLLKTYSQYREEGAPYNLFKIIKTMESFAKAYEFQEDAQKRKEDVASTYQYILDTLEIEADYYLDLIDIEKSNDKAKISLEKAIDYYRYFLNFLPLAKLSEEKRKEKETEINLSILHAKYKLISVVLKDCNKEDAAEAALKLKFAKKLADEVHDLYCRKFYQSLYIPMRSKKRLLRLAAAAMKKDSEWINTKKKYALDPLVIEKNAEAMSYTLCAFLELYPYDKDNLELIGKIDYFAKCLINDALEIEEQINEKWVHPDKLELMKLYTKEAREWVQDVEEEKELDEQMELAAQESADEQADAREDAEVDAQVDAQPSVLILSRPLERAETKASEEAYHRPLKVTGIRSVRKSSKPY